MIRRGGITVYALLFLMVLISTSSSAQRKFGIFAGGGATWYNGDMNDRLITHQKLFRGFWTAGLLYRATPRFHFTLSYESGKLTGADSLAIQDYQRRRNLHFRSVLRQGSFHINYRLLRERGRNGRSISPYLIAGISYFHFNPEAEFNDSWIELQPLGTEGQYIPASDKPKAYSLNRFSFPLGIGVEFRISPSFSARIEASSHFTFFDYLDDLSTKYADSTLLAGTPNGALAVELASNLPNGYPQSGFNRGNSNNNDAYFLLGATLLYTPGASKASGGKPGDGPSRLKGRKKKATCPAYK